MPATALESEVGQYIAELSVETDGYGWRPVVRNGHHKARPLATTAGPVQVKAPRMNDRRRRGMRDPELVTGDGAMGLWRALAEVFLAARPQRCWVHRARNVTNRLPRSAQPGTTKAMQEICNAEDRDELPAFYDFPAGRWIPLRTTDPIKSALSTVRLRTEATRGAGSPAASLAMVFKLVGSAQARWRAITAVHLVFLVRAGARCENGLLAEREERAA